MGVTSFLGSIPFVPTKTSIGARMMGRSLERVRGDADFVGIVKGNDGWQFAPCDMVVDGEDQFAVPIDGDREFPADGIQATPTRMYGVPVAIGYKDFGALNEIPNSKISRNAIITVTSQKTDDTEETVDREDSVLQDDVDESVTAKLKTLGSQMKADVSRLSSAIRGGVSRVRQAFHSWEDRKSWTWLQGDADALVIEQDGDSALLLERADYQTGEDGPDWYEARLSGYYYDARGAGAPPTDMGYSDLSMAHAQTPKLLAPVLCRLARNMHENRIVAERSEFGGQYFDEHGRPLQTDGGHEIVTDGGTNAKAVTADRGDIMVEERAFVSPEDVKLLGGSQETQDKINTLLRQTEAKENTPGSTLGKQLLDFGKIAIAFILGSVLAGGGGGDGGGSNIPSSPLMVDVGPLLEVVASVPI